MKKTVKQLYNYSLLDNRPLLSNYNAEWWTEYVNNHAIYDRAFNRLYRSFRFAFDTENDTDMNSFLHFVDEVKALLAMHSKKYAELYKVHALSENAYDIVSNYDMVETMDRDTASDKGQRTDTYTDSIGAQTNNLTNSTSSFDSDTMHPASANQQTVGAQSNSGSAVSGAEYDTASEDYTLTRKGNIGVVSAPDLLEKHTNFWTSFDFYSYIFKDICTELLEVNTDDY